MKGALPYGWAADRVGQLFHSFGGGTPSRSVLSYWSGKIPWISSGDVKADRIRSSSEYITRLGLENSSARLCRRGSVLVVVRSGILKHTLPVGVLESNAAINQDIKCFDSGSDDLNLWLALALRASAKNIIELNREGTTVQSVKYETLRDFHLKVPPLAEQRRIVAKLQELISRVDASRARLDQVERVLERFRRSVVAAACSGELTADWREGHGSNGMASDELPVGWKLCTVGDVIESLKYGTARKCDYEKRGIPVLRIPNVANGVIDHSDLKYATLSAAERRQLRLVPGDILLIRSNGSVSLVGRTALVRQAEGGFAYAGYLIRLRPRPIAIMPEFLNLALGSFDVRLQIELEARSTSGVHNINGDEVRALTFALPPTDEQREIVRRVGELLALHHRMVHRLTESHRQVDKLTSALLEKAFRGELVPTEAELARQEGREYESGAMLLERVRQQTMADKKQEPVRARGEGGAGVRRRVRGATG